MQIIKARFSSKDRIICISVPGKHQFYYQPAGTHEQIWLFDTKAYSRSIFHYFHRNGRRMGDKGSSLTIKEIYEFKEYHNFKLAALMERLPRVVAYVIRERYEEERGQGQHCSPDYCGFVRDDSHAA